MTFACCARMLAFCCGLVLVASTTTMSEELHKAEDFSLIEALLSADKNFLKQKGPQQPVHLTILGLQLEKHTLNDALKKLGPASQIEVGHHSYPFVCYRSSHHGDNTVLVLTVDDYRDPPLLTGYQLIAGSERFKMRGSCTRSELVSKTLATEGGAKLGMAREEITRIWGVPITNESGDHLGVSYKGYEEAKHHGRIECDLVFSWVAARFVDSRVTWLAVSIGGEQIRMDRCTEEELSSHGQQ